MKNILLFFVVILSTIIAQAQSENFIVGIDVFASKIKADEHPQIVDVRSPEEFSVNHVSNAVNIDLSAPDYKQKLQTLSKEKPVFIYAINVSRSGKLARELLAAGYKEVYVLKGGIANWIGSGQSYYSSVKNKLTKEEFNQLVSSDKPILIEFGSRYCGACKRAAYIIDSLQNNGLSVKVVQIDINDNHELVSKLNFIHAVPTLAFYQNNSIVWKKEGIDALETELTEAFARVNK